MDRTPEEIVAAAAYQAETNEGSYLGDLLADLLALQKATANAVQMVENACRALQEQLEATAKDRDLVVRHGAHLVAMSHAAANQRAEAAERERDEARAQVARVKAECSALAGHIEGVWPADDPRRVFVAGAAWWQFHNGGATAFSSERGEMEDEAQRRIDAALATDGAKP